jgi:hypothetical protein
MPALNISRITPISAICAASDASATNPGVWKSGSEPDFHSCVGDANESVPALLFPWSRLFWRKDSPRQKSRDRFELQRRRAAAQSAACPGMEIGL